MCRSLDAELDIRSVFQEIGLSNIEIDHQGIWKGVTPDDLAGVHYVVSVLDYNSAVEGLMRTAAKVELDYERPLYIFRHNAPPEHFNIDPEHFIETLARAIIEDQLRSGNQIVPVEN